MKLTSSCVSRINTDFLTKFLGLTRFRRGLQSSAGHTEAQLPRKYN